MGGLGQIGDYVDWVEWVVVSAVKVWEQTAPSVLFVNVRVNRQHFISTLSDLLSLFLCAVEPQPKALTLL